MKSLSTKQINQANVSLNDFVRNGWNSGIGQGIRRQGLISSVLPMGMFIYQAMYQNYHNNSALWQPIEQALFQAGFSQQDIDGLRGRDPGNFSGVRSNIGTLVSSPTSTPTSSAVSTPTSSGVGQRQYGGMQTPVRQSVSRNAGISPAPSVSSISNFTSQQTYDADQAFSNFLKQGWSGGPGKVILAQGPIASVVPMMLFLYQSIFYGGYGNRTDLWKPIEDSLIQANVLSQAIINQVRSSRPGDFSAVNQRVSQMHGESNPQALVDQTDQHFQLKGFALAKGIITGDPRTLSRLTQVRNGAQSGDWANRQIMAYTREALIDAGAPADMISQATMHGEGDIERAVEATIIRANNHDQNAMALLDQVRRQAMKGVPDAVTAYNHAMQVISGRVSSGDAGQITGQVSQGDLRSATMGCEVVSDPLSGDVTGMVSGRLSTGDEGWVVDMGAERRKPPAKLTKQNIRHARIMSHPAARDNHHPVSTLPGGGSGSSSGGSTPIDQLLAAAKAGNPSAIRELNRIMAAETRGDQRAVGLMRAIRHKATNTPKGKQGRAVALSHGKPLTRHRIAKMAGDFGYEYGPAGASYFLRGVAQPNMPVPSDIHPEVANCITTGQCVGMARNLQAVRVPGANLSGISAMMGWEQGEASTLKATMGWEKSRLKGPGGWSPYDIDRIGRNWGSNHAGSTFKQFGDDYAMPSAHALVHSQMGAEGQITAAEAGDPYFARNEMARGDVGEIHVNRTAFMLLLKQRNRLAKSLDNILAEIADMKHVARMPPTIIIVTRDTGDDGCGGECLVGMSATVAGDMGDEGQITAAQMGDPHFATQQMATGNVQQINVNRDAFKNLFQQREILSEKLVAATAERNALIQEIH